MGKSFECIISKDQYEGVTRIVSRNGGQIVSENLMENGIHLKIAKNFEPKD